MWPRRSGGVLGAAGFCCWCSGLTIEPLPRVHVDDLSNEDFDSLFLDRLPVVLSGTTACPKDLSFSHLEEHCDGSVPGQYVHTKDRGGGRQWAGMKPGDESETVGFVDFARSMGATPGEEPRFMFDIDMVDVCPSLLGEVQIPPQLVNIFASQFLWRHLPDSDPRKCRELPFFNLYLAEDGFQTDLHIDMTHTAFVSSMCEGRKRWRVMTADDFSSVQSLVSLSDEGRRVDGRWIMSDIRSPFDTWTDDSPLHSLDVTVYEGTLDPGDILYIPPGAPHAATTLGRSIMVASNDQSVRSLGEIVEYCDAVNDGWYGCGRYREKFSVVRDNRQRHMHSLDREGMVFGRSFGCEAALKKISQSRLVITPTNFALEAQKGPLVVMKYVRSCIDCINLFDILQKIHPSVRWGVLNCPLGRCPHGESKAYQNVLHMARGDPPEFVLVTPLRKALAVGGGSEDSYIVEVPIVVSHYYGPLELDFLRAWVAIKTGSETSISPLWWMLFVLAFNLVNELSIKFLQSCGIPPLAEDATTMSIFIIVILFLVMCIGCGCTFINNKEKKKEE